MQRNNDTKYIILLYKKTDMSQNNESAFELKTATSNKIVCMHAKILLERHVNSLDKFWEHWLSNKINEKYTCLSNF